MKLKLKCVAILWPIPPMSQMQDLYVALVEVVTGTLATHNIKLLHRKVFSGRLEGRSLCRNCCTWLTDSLTSFVQLECPTYTYIDNTRAIQTCDVFRADPYCPLIVMNRPQIERVFPTFVHLHSCTSCLPGASSSKPSLAEVRLEVKLWYYLWYKYNTMMIQWLYMYVCPLNFAI